MGEDGTLKREREILSRWDQVSCGFVIVCPAFSSLSAFPVETEVVLKPLDPPPKGRAWGTTLSLCFRHGHKKSKAKAPMSGSVNGPRGNVGGPRRKITCDSPLVRIFRWFVTLFDFLLIEWIFNLDSLSLSDSSSSFFLYFRTEREECRDTSECVQPDSTLHERF